MQDDVKQFLERMDVPEPSVGAAQRVVSQAKYMQQNRGLWMRFKHLRGWFLQTNVRYGVMATAVVALALLGTLASNPVPAPSEPPMQVATTDPLEGLDSGFAEFYTADNSLFTQTESQPDSTPEATPDPLEGIDAGFEQLYAPDWSV